MTDKKNLLKGGLRKPVKRPLPDTETTNNVTEKVHQKKEEEKATVAAKPKAKKEVVAEPKAPMAGPASKRTSIDFPFEVYVAIKQQSFIRGITFKEYVLEAVKASLKK